MLTLGTELIAGLTVAGVFTLMLVAVPSLARFKGLWLVSMAAAIGYYRREALGFLIVTALSYLAVYLLSRVAPPRRWRFGCLLIVTLVAVFTWGRLGHWNRPLTLPAIGPFAVYSLGMWHALRLVTLFWEVGSGSVARPSLSQYVLWICLPFTLGGPILRWSQMPPALGSDPRILRMPAWWLGGAAATAKLVTGVSLAAGQVYLNSHVNAHYLDNVISTFVTGPLGFYLTSAGYLHWMELLARCCCVKLPESYNSPVGRENISAFWMNWNMTATYVFRDYLFYNRWGRRNYNVYFNTLLLFTLVGLWHAANAYWILWGFLHGLLFCTFLVWRKYGQRLDLPLRGTPISNLAARASTYFCVCMCWYLPSKILQKAGAL